MISNEVAKENIPANVRRLLDAKQLSQADLARLTGENNMYISRVVRGEILPNAPALARIAEALGVTSEKLMTISKNSRKHTCSL